MLVPRLKREGGVWPGMGRNSNNPVGWGGMRVVLLFPWVRVRAETTMTRVRWCLVFLHNPRIQLHLYKLMSCMSMSGAGTRQTGCFGRA